jgi:dihydropteroate synthase
LNETDGLQLHLGEHVIDCTDHTAVMGILNVSYDSPVAQSVFDPREALERAIELHEAGAEIVDVGAHSTRAFARDLDPQEEIERVCPVIEAIQREGIPVSVDTWTPAVARAAAEAGAHLLNDVTGFTNAEMVAVAAEYQLPVVAMHMRGTPKHHYDVDQHYADISTEVEQFLLGQAETLRAAGIGDVWLDPGFAFGKSVEDNLRLLHGLPSLLESGYPVLISASRKGFLAEAIGLEYSQQADGLLEATIAFNTLAASLGVHVVRVHDVAEVARALRVVDAFRQTRGTPRD